MKNKLKKEQNLAGFTLIELLVVIVIIGILATVSVVTFQGYFEKARMAKAKANYSQIKSLFLAQNASTESELFTGWYSFDGDADINLASPYILDKSGAGNHLTSIVGSGIFSQSEETGFGIGKSLRTNGRQFYKPGNFGGRPVDKITISFWVKMEEYPPVNITYPVYAGTSGVIFFSDGRTRFYMDNGSDSLTTESESIKEKQWHYFVASYGDETMRIWIDGDLIATKENVVQDMSFSSGLKGVNMGYYPGTSYFNGWLDEVMFFPYAFGGEKLE